MHSLSWFLKVKVLDGLFYGLHKSKSSEHFLKQIKPASNFCIFKANKRMCSKKSIDIETNNGSQNEDFRSIVLQRL